MTSYFSTIVMLNIKAAVAAGEQFAAKQREKEIKLRMLCKLSIQEAWAGKPSQNPLTKALFIYKWE